MTDTETPSPRGKKMIPVPTDSIEVGGERLVRVARTRKQETIQSLDEVVKKHLDPEVIARVGEEYGEILEALVDGGAPTSEETLASRIELFPEGEASVPVEDAGRDAMRVSPIIPTPDAPDFLSGHEPPKTLFDLFALYPLDGVNYEITVERIKPSIWGGLKASGYVRTIYHPVSLGEWQDIYGGGTYRLTVYGPPKSGGTMRADGTYPKRRLTEPILVEFPGVPSLECLVIEDSPAMNPDIAAIRRGPATQADAAIETKRLDLNNEREKRLTEEAKHERSERDRVRREAEDKKDALTATLIKSNSDLQAELRNLIAEQHRREEALNQRWEARLDRIRDESKQQPSELEQFAKVMGIMHPPRDADVARELERLQEQLRDREKSHEAALRAERDRNDRVLEDERRRAEERVSTVEKRVREIEQDHRSRADREIQAARDELERRIAEMHRQHETRVADLERSHQRDLQAKDHTHQMQIETTRQNYESRLDLAKSEEKRSKQEQDRLRREAEEGRDVVGQLEKIKQNAALVGMVDASEVQTAEAAPDFKTMALQTGLKMAEQLPSMIDSLATIIKGRPSAPALPQTQADLRTQMVADAARQIPSGYRPRRAVGGSAPIPQIRHMSEVSSPPIVRPPGAEGFLVPEQTMAEQMPPPPPPPMAPPGFDPGWAQPAPGMTGMPPEMSPLPPMPVQQAPAPPPPMPAQASVPPPAPALAPHAPSVPPAAPSGISPEELALDQQILMTDQLLRPPFESGISADAVAEQFKVQIGPENIQQILTQVGSIDRLILAYERSGDPESPFVKRKGKQYLRALWRELEARRV